MLSEEESKAIKILLEFRDYYAREDINRENFNNEENYKKALNGIKILKNSFDTVINLVTRLQKENEEKDKYIKHSEEITTEMNEDINKLLIEIKEKDKQINSKNGAINALQCALKERTEERDRKDNIVTKQNKIIDLTINFIYEIWCKYPGSISHELRLNGFNDDECGTCENTNRNCIECLKQYFEKLAKEKGE